MAGRSTDSCNHVRCQVGSAQRTNQGLQYIGGGTSINIATCCMASSCDRIIDTLVPDIDNVI